MVKISKLAQPYQGLVEFDYKDLRDLFDEFWKENEEAFIKKYNIKARVVKGGHSPAAKKMAESSVGVLNLYSRPLLDKSIEELKKEEDDVLYVETIDLRNFEEDKTPVVQLKFYKHPEVVLNDDLVWSDDVEDPITETAEDVMETNIKMLKRKHKVLLDVINKEVDDSCSLLLEVSGELGHRPKWIDYEDLSEELKGSLLGKKKDDQIEVELEPGLLSVAKIHDLKVIELPSEEELPELEGFGSMEELRSKFRSNFSSYVINTRTMAAIDHYIDMIIMNSKVGAIPQTFLDMAVMELQESHLQQFHGDEKKAMEVLGCVDKTDYFNKFAGQVIKDLAQKLALRYYADKFNLDKNNIMEVQDHMMEKVNWV